MARLTKKHVAGFFLTGAAAGAILSLLYAPKSGVQTRKDIRKFSKRTVDRLDDWQDDVRGQVGETYEQAMEVLDNVKEYVEDGKNKLKKMIKTA